jgi:hypothetical protein
VRTVLDTTVNLISSYGDERRAVNRSLTTARRRAPFLDKLLSAPPHGVVGGSGFA